MFSISRPETEEPAAIASGVDVADPELAGTAASPDERDRLPIRRRLADVRHAFGQLDHLAAERSSPLRSVLGSSRRRASAPYGVPPKSRASRDHIRAARASLRPS